MRHDFSDAEVWAARFEDPARAAWQQPEKVIAALIDRPDLVVVDIGSATGYFPVRFARAVPRGQVFGIDIEETLVEYLNARARREGLKNLTSVLARPDDASIRSLPAQPDLVFVCNTYHHIGARARYFGRVRREAAPNARLVIVDFLPGSKKGPPAKHKLPPEQVVSELRAAGWRLHQRFDWLPEQYFLVFVSAE